MVHVATPKSAWEQMTERMSDAPLIKRILKESKKFKKVAGDTEVGKKAQQIGEKVTHKVEVRS